MKKRILSYRVRFSKSGVRLQPQLRRPAVERAGGGDAARGEVAREEAAGEATDAAWTPTASRASS